MSWTICAPSAILAPNAAHVLSLVVMPLPSLTNTDLPEHRLCEAVTARVSFIARVIRYPGEDEMQALADGALRVLENREPALDYE